MSGILAETIPALVFFYMNSKNLENVMENNMIVINL